MTMITQAVMVQATIDVNGMSTAQRLQLADEIHARQPNLLASILVLPHFGVDAAQLEIALYVLLLTFQAMKRSGHAWPTISEDVQEICMQRLTATVKFSEGLSPELIGQAMTQFCADHLERYLLAFAYGYLGEHDLLSVSTDAEKFLLLSVLNLVECVAFVGTHTLPGTSSAEGH
jgi:hypothetical protein